MFVGFGWKEKECTVCESEWLTEQGRAMQRKLQDRKSRVALQVLRQELNCL